MPVRDTGLRGYLGEEVISQWLRSKFCGRTTQILPQIMPADYDPRGGPYLDFGVIIDGIVHSLYEVKTQDVIWDAPPNGALSYIWDNKGKEIEFKSLCGKRFPGSKETKAYLILLGPPNSSGIDLLGVNNLPNVMLFDEIMSEFGHQVDREELLSSVKLDIDQVLTLLANPTSGKRVRSQFILQRQSQTDDFESGAMN